MLSFLKSSKAPPFCQWIASKSCAWSLRKISFSLPTSTPEAMQHNYQVTTNQWIGSWRYRSKIATNFSFIFLLMRSPWPKCQCPMKAGSKSESRTRFDVLKVLKQFEGTLSIEFQMLGESCPCFWSHPKSKKILHKLHLCWAQILEGPVPWIGRILACLCRSTYHRGIASRQTDFGQWTSFSMLKH